MNDNNINARIALTKFLDTFTGAQGETVKFEYVEVEFAPNCYCRFKLNSANKRCLQKYAPNMYQLLSNIPLGHTVMFIQESPETSGIEGIYNGQENEL